MVINISEMKSVYLSVIKKLLKINNIYFYFQNYVH